MDSGKNQEDFYGKNYKGRKEGRKFFFLLALLSLILTSCSWENNNRTYIKIRLPVEERGRSVFKDATIEGNLVVERVSGSNEDLDQSLMYQKEINFTSSSISIEIPGDYYYLIDIAMTVTKNGRSEKYFGYKEEYIVANAANTVNLECQKILNIESCSENIDECRTFSNGSETYTLECSAKQFTGEQLYFHAYEVTLNGQTSIADQLTSQLTKEYTSLLSNPSQIVATIAGWAGTKDENTKVCSWSKTFSESTACDKYYVIVVHTIIDTNNLQSSFENFAYTDPIRVHLYQSTENEN